MIFLNYIVWHYTKAPLGILVLLKNFTIATWHKFFIGRHFKTLFSTWHRMRAKYMWPPKKFADKIGNIIVEVFIRFIAALIRSAIIITGLIAEVVIISVFSSVFILWILWPLIFIWLLSKGFALLF